MVKKYAYRIDEIAKLLQVSEKTIRREISSGRLDAIKIRGSVRIPREFLQKYLKDRHADFLKELGFEKTGSGADCDGQDFLIK